MLPSSFFLSSIFPPHLTFKQCWKFCKAQCVCVHQRIAYTKAINYYDLLVVVVLLLLHPLLHQVDQSALNKAIEELRASGVQVFVSTTDPGVRPSLPQGVRLLDYGSSMSQAAELVTHICHMDQVSSLSGHASVPFFFSFFFVFLFLFLSLQGVSL